MIALSRRELMVLAGAGAGLALIDPGISIAEGPVNQAQLVRDLLAAELLGIATLERVLLSPHLSPRARRLSRRILGQEHRHATALGRALAPLGGTHLPVIPATAAEIDRQLSDHHVGRTVGDLHSEHDCLDLLLDLEGVTEGGYYRAMAKLTAAPMQTLAATLLASDAQHEALLGELRQPKNFDRAAPYAFVEGSG